MTLVEPIIAVVVAEFAGPRIRCQDCEGWGFNIQDRYDNKKRTCEACWGEGTIRAAVRVASPMLSRVLPGQSHPMHVDIQRSDWLTRVHIPLTTNDGCWMAWEEEGAAHQHQLLVGYAYTFNTLLRHAFGNDGETERVHLIFDVLRG